MYWRLLRDHRDFRLLYFGTLISLGGDWFLTVALFDLVLQLTGSATLVSLILLFQTLPIFFFTPHAGHLIDRVDRRKLMIGVDIARVFACLLPLLARSPAMLPFAFAGVLLISIGSAYFEPASQAALPNIVKGEELAAANVLMGSTWGTMLAAGAALGGAVTAGVGRDTAFVVDGHLQPARDHDAAFLAVMGQRHPAGVAARLVALFQDLQAPAEQIVADLAEGDRLLADLGQFVGAIERLARPLRLDREEFGEPHREAVEDALERADRRVHLVGFDQRDRRIGDAGALGQLALGELVTRPNEAESPTDIDAHRFFLLQVFRIEQICAGRTSKINGLQNPRKGLVVPSRAWPGGALSCQHRSHP